MKKLNNRGYLLAEIVVAFVLAMMMAYFLGNITVSLSNKEQDLSHNVKFNTDKALITKEIMDDVNKYGVDSVNINNNMVDITYSGEIKKRILIDVSNKIFKYCLLDGDICKEDEYVYIKYFDKSLNLGTLSIINDTSTGSGYNFLEIRLPATTIYSDIDYGLNIIVPYLVKND